MAASGSKMAVILTALQVEYKAVRAYLTNRKEEIHPQGTVYGRGTFMVGGQSWDIALVEMGMGNSSAAVETERALQYFHPEVLLFVGVAGGLKDVQIGDVVAATKAYGYEFGKEEKTFKTRPEVGNSSYTLVQRARAIARDEDWLQRIQPSPADRTPQAYVGPIAAGSKVVASTQSATARLLRHSYGDALAVEMEGYGVLGAAHGNSKVEALIIRGISDVLDGKENADKSGSQHMAARHAAAFAFEILAKLAPASEADEPGPSPVQVPDPASAPGSSHVSELAMPDSSRKPKRPINIYYSYADEDEKLVRALQNQFSTWKKRGDIREWDASRILPGSDRKEEIKRHLNEADIILLCVSSDYLNSLSYEIEWPLAEERVKAKKARVVPVLFRRIAGLEHTDFGHLEMFPRSRLRDRDRRYIVDARDTLLAEVAEDVFQLIKEIS